MKLIVTLQNKDGSFDDVGMNNRRVVSGYKTVRNAMKFGVKPYTNNRAYRVEVYPSGNLYVDCNWVLYFDAMHNRLYSN